MLLEASGNLVLIVNTVVKPISVSTELVVGLCLVSGLG